MSDEERFNVYEAVTQNIIAAIEAGAGEYVMPWHGSNAPIGKPQNAYTKMEYHGLNILLLWAESMKQGYDNGYWASYRQWQETGAQVANGEKGTLIVFYKKFEIEEEDGQPGERLFARASRVFNAAQVAGWQAPTPKGMGEADAPHEATTLFVRATGANVHYTGASAYYDIREDAIYLPERSRFKASKSGSARDTESAILLHELVHWSGAKHRLDRGFDDRRKLTAMAEEELIAELGSAFLCADLGVSNTPRPDHASYVANWLTALRNDKKAIFKAARLATQAANYLHELASSGEWT